MGSWRFKQLNFFVRENESGIVQLGRVCSLWKNFFHSQLLGWTRYPQGQQRDLFISGEYVKVKAEWLQWFFVAVIVWNSSFWGWDRTGDTVVTREKKKRYLHVWHVERDVFGRSVSNFLGKTVFAVAFEIYMGGWKEVICWWRVLSF